MWEYVLIPHQQGLDVGIHSQDCMWEYVMCICDTMLWSILKHLFWVTYHKAKIIQNIIIFLVLTISFSNTEAYQRSQYQIEHKSKDAWLSWGTKRNWGVYINILQFLSNIGASQSPPLKSLTSSLKPTLWGNVSSPHGITGPALIPYVTTQGKALATSALYLKRTSHY